MPGSPTPDVYSRPTLYTSPLGPMRTNIVIDDALMKQAMQASGARSKREAVELGLRTLVKLQQQAQIRAFRGRLSWEGDLEAQRLDGETEAAEHQP
ncbi:type II toxin-antitoxin system VapB family antitoxin [Synechococcus sp. EJ6-Ellesmere]|uniref:type II toxin-antitoxin system VapB family antitoxin n=1 Tax=Synechococcus sp. EJ6-Ellesmere TaxID=2823734 RepID=UPI0020CF1770|nr:type II toxin-antitoxin system VapB family antitoxin [Synechococcus sp. EJ6-Ellesmere]